MSEHRTEDPIAEWIGTEQVLADVLAKRKRQVSVHGWRRTHDDEHTCGELAQAAIPYIQAAYRDYLGLTDEELTVFWPWDAPPDLQQDVRELLINAAALIVSEIERLDRESRHEYLSSRNE